MQFIPAKREDIPVRTREGSVSTALIKGFLDAVDPESGEPLEVANIDLTGHDKTLESTRATISNYVQRHTLPVRVFSAGNTLWLERNESMVEKYRAKNAKAAEKSNGQTATTVESPASDEED